MIQQRQLLDGQLNENKNVLEELNMLSEEKNKVEYMNTENIITSYTLFIIFFLLGI